MRKIGFFNYISFFASSALLGIVASVGLIFLTKPFPAQVTNIPVISFNNVQLFRNNIESKMNPFGGPLAEIMSPKKPVVSSIPKPPSVPAEPVIPESERISVMGIMPPDTCIIRKGSEIVTVSSGQKTSVGSIGKVTSEGVYVDGKFYKMLGTLR